MAKTILILEVDQGSTDDPVKFDNASLQIINKVEDAGRSENFECIAREKFSLDDFTGFLSEFEPEILHLIGHGDKKGMRAFNPDSVFFKKKFSDVESDGIELDENAIVEIFASSKVKESVKLVFFNSCYSSRLAQALVERGGIKFSIGMEKSLDQRLSIPSAAEFYASLAKGESVFEAFTSLESEIASQMVKYNELLKTDNQQLKTDNYLDQIKGPPGHPKPILYGNEQDAKQFIFIDNSTSKPGEDNPVSIFLETALDYYEEELKKLFPNLQAQGNKQPKYIDIQVSTTKWFQYPVETPLKYAEKSAERKRLYAYKNFDERQERYGIDWKEVKARFKKLVVLSDSGMGKTTLLKLEAWKALRDQYQSLEKNQAKKQVYADVVLPLFVSLGELAEELQEEDEIIDAILLVLSPKPKRQEAKSLIIEKIKIGKCLLLLDGLDEVPSEKRDILKIKLDKFVSAYTGRIICTSRIIGYDKDLFRGDKEVEIIPFGQRQIEEYVDLFFTGKSMSRELIKDLRNNYQVQGLAQNPLLLSLICKVYETKFSDSKFSDSKPILRTQVYRGIFNKFLSKYYEDDDVKDAIEELLARISYNLTSNGKVSVSHQELDSIIREIFSSDDTGIKQKLGLNTDSLDLIHKFSDDNILRKIGLKEQSGTSYYLFSHRTFQEYFTALYLSKFLPKQEDFVEKVQEHFWKYEWHEIIILLTGLTRSKADKFRLIEALKEEKDDIFFTLKLLAGRCLAECQEEDSSLIDEIFKFWSSFSSAVFVYPAVIALGQANFQMLEKLMKILTDEGVSAKVKAETALVLGEIRNPKAVKVLGDALESDDPYLRRHAILALRDIGASEDESTNISAFEQLIKCFKRPQYVSTNQSMYGSDKAREIRSTLASMGDAVVEKLINLLNLKEESINFLREVAFTLAEVGSDRAIQALNVALNDQSKSELFQEQLVLALGRVSSPKVTSGLIILLRSKEKGVAVRKKTISVLGEKISDSDEIVNLEVEQEVVQALIEIFENREEALDIRRELVAAFDKLIILSSLSEDNLFTVVKVLLEVCDDPDDNRFIKEATRGILINIDESAKKAENKISGRIVTEVRLALERMNRGKVIADTGFDFDSLEKIITYLDPKIVFIPNASGEKIAGQTVRDAAELALREFKIDVSQKSDIQYLIDVLNEANQHENVKANVASLLARIGSEETTQALFLALKNEEIKSHVIPALEEFGTEDTLRRLIASNEFKDDVEIFCLTRDLAVKFYESKVNFIPVYAKSKLSPKGGLTWAERTTFSP